MMQDCLGREGPGNVQGGGFCMWWVACGHFAEYGVRCVGIGLVLALRSCGTLRRFMVLIGQMVYC